SRQRTARLEIEYAVVAWTVETLLRGLRHDWTREMGTLLAVGHQLTGGRTHQQAYVTLAWILKQPRAARRNLVSAGDLPERRESAGLAPEMLAHDPDLSGDKCCAGEKQHAGEVAPRAVLILRPVDRKGAPPDRLALVRLPVRPDGVFEDFVFHSWASSGSN